MSEMKKVFGVLLILGVIIFLFGCSTPRPVPENAVSSCLNTGFIPEYFSNQVEVRFNCDPRETEVADE